VTKGARIRILSAGVISNFIVAALAMALFFGPVIGSISPIDRVIVVDVKQDTPGISAGFESGMALMIANGKAVDRLDDLFNNLSGGSSQIQVLNEGKEENLQLTGVPARGIMVASIFEDSPAAQAGLFARAVITKIDGKEIGDLDGFRHQMNTTHPGQTIAITTGDGGIYQVNLTKKTGDTGFIGIGISGNAVYSGGVAFQEAPAKQFLQVLKAIPSSGLQGFTYLLSLPFSGIPGFTQKGFPGFSGWLTTVFEPTGWAEPMGEKFFWIANLLLWIGWINLYAGLFNCLPAVPLDGGHIFRDLVQLVFERVVNPSEAEKLTKTAVAFLAWLVLASLVITVMAPFTHWFSI
jgi:membrane-associated protease RseP (regulator of RpoE activity)